MTSVKLILDKVWGDTFAPFSDSIYRHVTTEDVSIVPMDAIHEDLRYDMGELNTEDMLGEIETKNETPIESIEYDTSYENSHVCNMCFKPLNYRKFVRIPCVFGGWTGYYCSWQCSYESNCDSGMYEYERLLMIAYFERLYSSRKELNKKNQYRMYNMGLFPYMAVTIEIITKYQPHVVNFMKKYKLNGQYELPQPVMVNDIMNEDRESERVGKLDHVEEVESEETGLRRRTVNRKRRNSVTEIVEAYESMSENLSDMEVSRTPLIVKKEEKVSRLISFFSRFGVM